MGRNWLTIIPLLVIPILAFARATPTEPYYKLAYLEAQLEGIRDLPEEEQFLYLSYSNLINPEYYIMVHHMIVTKHSIEQRISGGELETDPGIQEARKDLDQYLENLRKESKRFLGYAEKELKIGQEALKELDASSHTGYLRWDYYQLIHDRLWLEWLKGLSDEELFLYLSDRGPVNIGFRNLVDEFVVAKSRLLSLPLDKEGNSERYIRMEETYGRTRSALKVETQRILKALELQLLNSERAFEIARERLDKKEPSIAVDIR